MLVVPGEVMEFRISLRGVTMGEVQTAIGAPGMVGGPWTSWTINYLETTDRPIA